jgi:hypothetical protein
MTRFTTPNDILVVADFPNFSSQTFKTFEAVTKSGTATPYYDGGARTPDLLGGVAELGTARLSRGWNDARDFPLIRYLDPIVMELFFTVTKTFRDASGKATSNKIEYRVLLTGVGDPPAETGPTTTPGTLDLTVYVQSRTIL